MRSRPRRAVGLSEVQEGRKAPGSDDAPACPALAPAAAAGKLNAKLKSDFRCYPDNGHAATASACPFRANFGSGRCALDALVPSEETTRTPHLLQTEERELICDVPRSS
jgi:hypothetical protein